MRDIDSVLLLLAALQIKHAIGDYFLQSAATLESKSRYGGRGGIVHALHHVWLGFVPLAWFCEPWSVALALALLDGIVHYHIDWQKARWTRRLGWTSSMARYWHAFAIDQALHQLTYLAIAWLALRFGVTR